MNSLRTYFRERFPLPATLLLAVSTAAILLSATSTASSKVSASNHLILNLQILAAFSAAFFGFMLRMRVTDEFKDAGHDGTNYPNRPLQRGAITTHDLKSLGVLGGFLELVGVIAAGYLAGNPAAALWYLPVVLYSLLTRYEFFAKSYLETHFNLYFIAHQAIYVLFAAWAMAVFQTEPNTNNLLRVLGFQLLMMVAEVARKFEVRYSPEGGVVRDTYITAWGRVGASVAMAIGLLAATGLLTIGGRNAWSEIPALFGAVAALGLRQREKAAQAGVYLAFIAIAVIGVIA